MTTETDSQKASRLTELTETHEHCEKLAAELDTWYERRAIVANECRDAGVSAIEIADVLGVSRARAYAIIEQGKPDR